MNHDVKNFGYVIPKRDRLRCFININKYDTTNKANEDGKTGTNAHLCGSEKLEFDIDFEFWDEDPDRPKIEEFITTISKMFETGLIEVPLSIYSPNPCPHYRLAGRKIS